MDSIEIKDILDELIVCFKEEQVKDILIYLNNSSEVNINIYDGELDKFTISDENLIFIEGNYDGYLGYTYLEKLDKRLFKGYCNDLKNVAKSNKIIFNRKPLTDSILNKHEFKVNDYNDIIDRLKELEKYTLNLDDKVSNITECSYYHRLDNILLKDDKGIEMLDSNHYISVNLDVVVKSKDRVENARSFRLDKEFNRINLSEMADECVSEALNKLTIEEFDSGNYPVILNNNVVAEIISCYMPIFSGDVIERDMSILKDKLNEKIGYEKLNIVECPNLVNGKLNRTFDDEGTKTYDKYIIKDGYLANILTNNDTSNLTNNISTGNGFKKIYKEKTSVNSTNIYMIEGEYTLEEMIKTIDKGVLITEITGLHAGINTVSGDFSLSSSGYILSEGKKGKYIGNITISGNIYNMINNIEFIGKELKSTPKEYSFVMAPPIKINNLYVTK